MDSYLDIVVVPDPEISAPALMSNLFAKLHRGLVQRRVGDIGISFPDYGKTLGNTLRLHGTCSSLDELMSQNWLKGLRDYTQCTDICPVPENVAGYRTVFRVQQKSAQNKRKRSVAKGWLTAEEAQHRIPEKNTLLKVPFVQIRSQSTQQTLYVFIQQGDLKNEPTEGDFSSYGLSRIATVPCF